MGTCLSTELVIMKLFLAFLVLSTLALAQGACPKQPKCGPTQKRCPGPPKYGPSKGPSCPSVSMCVPRKSGKCSTPCPTYCNSKYQKRCPGGRDSNNCLRPYFCAPKSGYCPARCSYGQKMCTGPRDKNNKPTG